MRRWPRYWALWESVLGDRRRAVRPGWFPPRIGKRGRRCCFEAPHRRGESLIVFEGLEAGPGRFLSPNKTSRGFPRLPEPGKALFLPAPRVSARIRLSSAIARKDR